MTDAGAAKWIAVIGDRSERYVAQDAIGDAVEHAAASLEVRAPEVRWIATDELERSGSAILDGAAAVWCAPGSPYRSMSGALEGIRWARETRVPFIGTCAGFQHGVIELARNVLGVATAAHAEYEPAGDVELFIDELLCSLVGQTMHVQLVDPVLVELYGASTATERYYCRFGLNPAHRPAIEAAGLEVGGVDASDGDVRVLRLVDHPFYVLTLFVPQTSSAPGAPHPLVLAFVREALSSPAGAGQARLSDRERQPSAPT